MAEKRVKDDGGAIKKKTAVKKEASEKVEKNEKSNKRAWHEPNEKRICDNSRELLNMTAINAATASLAIKSVLPHVSNEKFKAVLTADLEKYSAFNEKAYALAEKYDLTIQSSGGLGKFVVDSNIKMKLFFNSETTRIAEMLILGNTRGVIDLGRGLKHINDVNDEVRQLAKELLTFEEDRVNKLKYYL